MPEKPVQRVTGGIVFGFLILGIGILFMLDNFGIADFGSIVRWWPILTFGYGALLLAGVSGRPRFLAGSLVMAASLWLLLHNTGVIPYDLWDLWPLGLIVLGANMVWKAFYAPAAERPFVEMIYRAGIEGEPAASVEGAPAGTTASSWTEGADAIEATPKLNTVAVWSATRTQVVSRHFRGGDATAIMGGHDIDLRHAQLADGKAVLEVNVLMGGIDIFVPSDWKVSNEAFAMMGAIEDNTRAPAGPARGLLIIRGFVLMGGVEVKN